MDGLCCRWSLMTTKNVTLVTVTCQALLVVTKLDYVL